MNTRACDKCNETKSLECFYRCGVGHRHICKSCLANYSGLKVCIECNKEKPLADFHRNCRSRDGRMGTCKNCRNAYLRQWAQDNPEKKKASVWKYSEANRKRIAAKNRAYYNSHKDDEEFMERQRTNNRRYWENPCNRDKIRAKKRRQYWKNRERILFRRRNDPQMREASRCACAARQARLRGASGSFTLLEWQEILEQYNYRCLACGTTENISIDHIIPVSIGGTNYAANLQPLCKSCNSSKQAHYIDFRPNAYWSDWT